MIQEAYMFWTAQLSSLGTTKAERHVTINALTQLVRERYICRRTGRGQPSMFWFFPNSECFQPFYFICIYRYKACVPRRFSFCREHASVGFAVFENRGL